ncbi:MAG: tetratricopeptide repeat protein [Rhodospirillales bacterium]|nr:tetratricopeptide repeat protein [Rhodospirillales bacterium]
MGVLDHGEGDLAEALTHAQKAVRSRPDFAEGHLGLGLILADLGRLADALVAYRAALEIIPDLAEGLVNMGDVLRRLGQAAEARDCCRRAVTLAPQLAHAHANLGAALLDLDEPGEAAAALERALDLDAGLHSARINLGEALRRGGYFDRALELINGLAETIPDVPALHTLLGNIKFDQADLAGAGLAYARALELDASDEHGHNNMGNLLVRRGDLEAAVLAYDRALGLRPDFADALANLGAARQAQGHLDQALDCFEKALSIDEDHVDAHWNRGLARLLQGDLVGGFEDYEWRWRLPEFRRREAGSPLWQGQDLAGKTLLVQSEQGFGDTIQFIRLAPLLASRGARVILETHAALVDLLSSAGGLERAVARGDALPRCDFHIPILSLPHRLGIRLDSLPDQIPYLVAQPGGEEDLNMLEGPGFKLGLVWAGRETHKNDANRSCRLEMFKTICQIPGLKPYSLQLDRGAGELSGDLAPGDWRSEIQDREYYCRWFYCHTPSEIRKFSV